MSGQFRATPGSEVHHTAQGYVIALPGGQWRIVRTLAGFGQVTIDLTRTELALLRGEGDDPRAR